MSSIFDGGQCEVCGCTDARGCPGGCWWVDNHHTLCSVCLDTISVFLVALARRGQLADLIASDPGARVAPLGEPAAAAPVSVIGDGFGALLGPDGQEIANDEA